MTINFNPFQLKYNLIHGHFPETDVWLVEIGDSVPNTLTAAAKYFRLMGPPAWRGPPAVKVLISRACCRAQRHNEVGRVRPACSTRRSPQGGQRTPQNPVITLARLDRAGARHSDGLSPFREAVRLAEPHPLLARTAGRLSA